MSFGCARRSKIEKPVSAAAAVGQVKTGKCWISCNTLRNENISNKSPYRVQTSLAGTDHYPHVAWIPDLESQQILIWKSDKETCAQTYLVCWQLFLNHHNVSMQDGCTLSATGFQKFSKTQL